MILQEPHASDASVVAHPDEAVDAPFLVLADVLCVEKLVAPARVVPALAAKLRSAPRLPTLVAVPCTPGVGRSAA